MQMSALELCLDVDCLHLCDWSSSFLLQGLLLGFFARRQIEFFGNDIGTNQLCGLPKTGKTGVDHRGRSGVHSETSRRPGPKHCVACVTPISWETFSGTAIGACCLDPLPLGLVRCDAAPSLVHGATHRAGAFA